MTNEEMKALYEKLNTVEDAYAYMMENGYSGTLDDFKAICDKAAEEMPMDLDDMDQVAGGVDFSGALDKVGDAFGKTVDWMKNNPEAAAGIVGGVVAAGVGITYAANKYKQYKVAKEYNSDKVDAGSENPNVIEDHYVPQWERYRTDSNTGWELFRHS